MRLLEQLEARSLLDGGELDATFGDGGAAIVDFAPILPPGINAAVTDLAEDPNGYAILAGRDDEGSDFGDPSVLAARLTPDGQLDPNFGDGGLQTLPRRTLNGDPPQVTTDSFARVYVRETKVLMRLTTRGKLDATFGNRGKFKIPVLGSINDVHADELGRIYAFGSAPANSHDPDGPTRATIIRFNESGQLDTTFASGGVFRFPAPPADALGSDGVVERVRFLPGDLLLAAARASYRTFDAELGQDVTTHLTATARLHAPDGTLDTSYGEDGFAQFVRTDSDIQFFGNSPRAILSDGTVIGTWGSSNDNEPPNVTGDNFRISTDGMSIDESVDLVPQAIEGDFPDLLSINSAIVQSDDRIVSHASNTTLFRITLDGQLDTSWGDGGTVTRSELGREFLGLDDSLFSVFSDLSQTEAQITKRWPDDRPAARAMVKHLGAPRDGSIPIRVAWRDDDGLDQLLLASKGVFVEFPDGSRRSARLILSEILPEGTVDALYKLTRPDGTWDTSDNGQYRIFARSGAATDLNGVVNITRMIGSFRVDIG